MKKLSVLLTAIFFSSCAKVPLIKEKIDLVSFAAFGGTVFSRPDAITIKEIHLDKGLLVGQKVVVEGAVEELGKHGSYAIVSDGTARMLVVLTQIDVDNPILSGDPAQKVKVLGYVDSGKKGFPFIQAHAVVVQDAVKL